MSQYKRGAKNRVADALARRSDSNVIYLLSSSIVPTWMEEVKASYERDKEAMKLLQALTVDPKSVPNCVAKPWLICYKGKFYVGSSTGLRYKLLETCHEFSFGGHSGIHNTYKRLRQNFYWPSLRKSVVEWVLTCDVCRRCKSESCAYPSLLQPLSIPAQAWKSISRDFVTQLPKSHGYDTIFVVVDRFTKCSHFFALSHPYSAAKVAVVIMGGVLKLHEMLENIISDQDRLFTGQFWRELFKLLGTKCS